MGGTLKLECILVPPVLKECDGTLAKLRLPSFKQMQCTFSHMYSKAHFCFLSIKAFMLNSVPWLDLARLKQCILGMLF